MCLTSHFFLILTAHTDKWDYRVIPCQIIQRSYALFLQKGLTHICNKVYGSINFHYKMLSMNVPLTKWLQIKYNSDPTYLVCNHLNAEASIETILYTRSLWSHWSYNKCRSDPFVRNGQAEFTLQLTFTSILHHI